MSRVPLHLSCLNLGCVENACSSCAFFTPASTQKPNHVMLFTDSNQTLCVTVAIVV